MNHGLVELAGDDRSHCRRTHVIQVNVVVQKGPLWMRAEFRFQINEPSRLGSRNVANYCVEALLAVGIDTQRLSHQYRYLSEHSNNTNEDLEVLLKLPQMRI